MTDKNNPLPWSDEAEEEFKKVPGFAQKMARVMIEDFARDTGATEIDTELFKKARAKFGM